MTRDEHRSMGKGWENEGKENTLLLLGLFFWLLLFVTDLDRKEQGELLEGATHRRLA